MKSLEGRIEALERRKKRALPVYAITYANGQTGRLDALELFLAMAQQDAGTGPPIKYALRVSGELPLTGTVWETLEADLEKRLT